MRAPHYYDFRALKAVIIAALLSFGMLTKLTSPIVGKACTESGKMADTIKTNIKRRMMPIVSRIDLSSCKTTFDI